MPGPTAATTLRGRLTALSPRERGFLIAGALAVLFFLLYLLWPAEEAGDEIALTQAPPPVTPTNLPPLVSPPPPAPTLSTPTLPSAGAGAAAGLVLRGVMGGGPSGGAAIIAFPDGAQRVVRVGREFSPGMTLREIGVRHAIASSPSGDIRLELNKPGGIAVTSAAPADTPPAAAGAGAGGQRESLQYRLGLQPHKVEGRTRGYSIRPDANLPVLARAGLRPGDILVAVNGQSVESDEKVLDLPGEIAGAYNAEFEFIRAGRRMKSSLEVNKRR